MVILYSFTLSKFNGVRGIFLICEYLHNDILASLLMDALTAQHTISCVDHEL